MAADSPSRPEGKHTERSRKPHTSESAEFSCVRSAEDVQQRLQQEVSDFGVVGPPPGRDQGPLVPGSRTLESPALGPGSAWEESAQPVSALALTPIRTAGRLIGPSISPEDAVYGTFHIRGESRDAEEPLAESSPEHGPGSTDGVFTPEHSGWLSRLVQLEAQAFAASSLQAFAERFAEVVAAAHGLGPVFQCAKWAYGVVKWLHVIDGEGGVGLQIPFPMGPGVFSPAVHLGESSDIPLLTLSVAPTDVSGVGGLVIGKVEIDPEVKRADRQEAGPKHYGPVEAIPRHSPDTLPKPIPLPRDVAAARPLIEGAPPPDDMVLIVQRKKRRLHAAGVDLVIWYDLPTGLVVWQELCGADGPRRWSIADDLSDPR